MRKYIALCFCASLSTCGYGQENKNASLDTILFNAGKVLVAHVIDTSGDKVTIERPNSSKHKKIEIERSEIFSIKYANSGKEIILYIYDTLIGNDYTIPEARLFIAGEQDARRGFHAVGTSIGAFVVGAASGITGASFFTFGPPFLYVGIMSYPPIWIRHKSVSNINNVKADPYLYGYDNAALKKRVLRSLLWGSIGLVTGFIIHFTLLNNL